MILWMTLIKFSDGKMTGRNEVAATFSEAVKLILTKETSATEYYDVLKEEWIKIK